MVSTFGGLNAAFSGLTAARQGLDVIGQNLANATTAGYTRQRVTAEAVAAPARVGLFGGGSPRVGQGVVVTGIARIGDVYLDARARGTAAAGGNLAVRANTLTAIQASLNEPGDNGISAQLHGFWSAWQDVANSPGEASPSGVLLQKAGELVGQIAAGYSAVNDEWSSSRSRLTGMVDELNNSGSQIAQLNAQIRTTLAAGGSASELIDQRDTLTSTVASLTGGSVRALPDGTSEVLIGGNALVSGDIFHAVAVSGSNLMSGAAGDPVILHWVDRPAVPVSVESGEIAGSLAVLAPPNATGTGGSIAEAAAGYDAFATSLAGAVNAVHSAGATPAGTTGLDFFAISGSTPAALGLSVVPTTAAGIASGAVGAGALDGSTADAIGLIGTTSGSPDSVWSGFVARIGVATRGASQQSAVADSAASAASGARLANASVDTDEENVNMIAFQSSYQGSARVLTAIDQMLDVLINHTGIVGR